MDFLELAQQRFSVLEYTRQAVEQEKIDLILKAALAAPTACNRQPQRILVINDDESRRKLNNVVPSKDYVPVAFLVCYDKDECWLRPQDCKLSGDIDASIVATHMMLAMTDLGLGSIWVMYWDPDKMKIEFHLGENIEPVALLIAGYKAENAHPRKGHLESKTEKEIMISY